MAFGLKHDETSVRRLPRSGWLVALAKDGNGWMLAPVVELLDRASHPLPPEVVSGTRGHEGKRQKGCWVAYGKPAPELDVRCRGWIGTWRSTDVIELSSDIWIADVPPRTRHLRVTWVGGSRTMKFGGRRWARLSRWKFRAHRRLHRPRRPSR